MAVGRGGSNRIFVIGKMCLFPFSPWGKNGKSIWKDRETSTFHIHFPPFSSWGKMGKNEKGHIFPMGKNGAGPPRVVQGLYSLAVIFGGDDDYMKYYKKIVRLKLETINLLEDHNDILNTVVCCTCLPANHIIRS